jgi:hypothetical protein
MESPPKTKLLDQVRDAIQVKHYSIRTEQTYVDWIKRYILFHNRRHPREREMAAAAVLDQMSGTTQLMARLLYGSGLRLMERLRLRVQDLDCGNPNYCARGQGRKSPRHGFTG